MSGSALRWVAAAAVAELLILFGAPLVGFSFDLRGWFLLALLAILAVTVDLAVALGWNRWPKRLRLPGRALSLLAVTVAGTLVAGVFVNRQQGFYASFSDLWGRTRQQAVAEHLPADVTHARLDVLDVNWEPGARAAALHGTGTILLARLYGAHSGIERHAYVYLPAAYFLSPPNVRFPVIEFLHGQPGGPVNFLKQLGLHALLDEQIKARRLPPVIAVLPEETTHEVFDECVNAVHGLRNETYLTSDVVDDIDATFRALPGRSWGIAGYSTGGFCALNLASHHPDLYAVAASLSGYFTAGLDPHTGVLYAGSRTARRANSPSWWVAHSAPTAPALFLSASRQDSFAAAQLQSFASLLHQHAPLLPARVELDPLGGHNWNVWHAVLPRALAYMALYLPMPLAS